MYYPACIASNRTNPEFVSQYKGRLFTYAPTPDRDIGVERRQVYYVDDYRNPVCAAINFAWRFGAQKVMLFCCDSSFDKYRPTAVQLPNELWTYPQHLRGHEIVDANLYWMTHDENREVLSSNNSSGPEYKHAAYIKNDEEALEFFIGTSGES